MVSQDSNAGTVRGGALVAGPGSVPTNGNGKGTVGRNQGGAVASKWGTDPDDDDNDVFADAIAGQVAGHNDQEADLDAGEELDDRTMLDSVILPIISSVSILPSYIFTLSTHTLMGPHAVIPKSIDT